MHKVIGWVRLLIGVFLLVAGLYEIMMGRVVVGISWVTFLVGAYFVLGAFKHLKKEVSGKKK